jgi:hypothetical protein
LTGRITEQDQIDAIIKHCNGEKRRIELENVQLKRDLLEIMNISKYVKDDKNKMESINAVIERSLEEESK